MANPHVEQLLQDIESLIDVKLNDKFARLPLAVDTESVSFAQFEREKMIRLDGDEHITQGFFREYLRWMEQYYAYHLNFDADIVRQSIKVSDLLSGIYTAPDDTEYTGITPIFDELFTRVDTVDSELLALQQTVTDIDTDLSDLWLSAGNTQSALTTHTNNQAFHLIPDEVSILTDANKFKIKDAYVRGLFSGSNPIAISAGGAVSLKLDATTLEVNGAGNLAVKPTNNVTYTISFDSATSILFLTPSAGQPVSVDLTSLKTGGAVDMSNYVKKSGEASQTIAGQLIVTDQIKSASEITAFAP